MDDYRGYLICLTSAAILASVIRRMAPQGGPGRAARLGAGLLILLTALGPLARIDPLSAAEGLAKAGYSDLLTTDSFQLETNRLLSDLISQEAEAYILDKAEGLEVQVETAILDTYPVPWRVTIRGSLTKSRQEELSRMISEDLGIPEERQEWWSM